MPDLRPTQIGLATNHGKKCKARQTASCVWAPHCVCDSGLIRTCLWLRADRWASGQEAGQPPGSKSPHPDRRSEATGLHPFSTDGRGLKQRRSGLFWSRAGPPKAGLPKRLVLLAGRADEVVLIRSWATRMAYRAFQGSRYGAPTGYAATPSRRHAGAVSRLYHPRLHRVDEASQNRKRSLSKVRHVLGLGRVGPPSDALARESRKVNGC
jgi:hypothetical protein